MTSPVEQQAREILGTRQRQSPVAVVFLVIKSIRNLGISTLVVGALLIFNSPVPGGALAAIPVLILVALAFGILSWWRYTFVVEGDELRVTKGVVRVEGLTVPLDRVQSVAIEQEFLHRLVDLVRASVDTAGSSEAEFTIDAVPRPVAEALQTLTADRVSSGRRVGEEVVGLPDQPPPPPVPDQVLLNHSPGRLIRIALAQSPWAGLAFLAPLIAIGDDIREVLSEVFGFGFPELVSEETDLEWSLLWGVAALIVIATLLSLLLQVIRELTTNWNLTLYRTPTGLRRTAGLLSRTTKASSLAKIQRVSTRQTPVQRWFGLINLKLPTIGSGDLVLPGVNRDELERVRSILFDDHERIEDPARRVSPLAVFLAVRNSLVLAVLLFAALVSPLGWWSLVVFVIVPISGLAARRRVRLYRWDISEWSLVQHAEFFARSVDELTLRKTQSVRVRQSFFERRRELATVVVRTAEGSISVGMIPIGVAEAVRDRAIYTAETDHRQWM